MLVIPTKGKKKKNTHTHREILLLIPETVTMMSYDTEYVTLHTHTEEFGEIIKVTK